MDENLRFKWRIQSILAFYRFVCWKIMGLHEYNFKDDEDQE